MGITTVLAVKEEFVSQTQQRLKSLPTNPCLVSYERTEDGALWVWEGDDVSNLIEDVMSGVKYPDYIFRTSDPAEENGSGCWSGNPWRVNLETTTVVTYTLTAPKPAEVLY